MAVASRGAALLVAVILAAPSAGTPQGVPRAGDGVSLPTVIEEFPLTLPVDPLRPPVAGTVVLDAVIRETGAVGEVTIVEATDQVAGQAAVDTLRRWRFGPGTRDGMPVATVARFTYPVGLSASGTSRATSSDVAFPVGEGTVAPRLLREVKPAYPAAAHRAKVAGVVSLTCVVLTDGSPSDIRVAVGLEPSLDQAAVAALRLWQFEPGRRDGTPVPVQVEAEFSFQPQ
jgi:TonB family protein